MNTSLEKDRYSVLVVEDDDITREYICNAVTNHPALLLIANCSDISSAQKTLETIKPSVLLTDLALPDGDGVDLIRHTKHLYPSCECMVISVFGTESRVLSAIAAGAAGYLLKDEPYERIAEAILSLIHGGSPISPNIARHLLERFNAQVPTENNHLPLTHREIEILSGLAKGYTYQEMANKLSLSAHTVGTHVKNIYRKLEVCSRSEAVFEALQLGIIRVNNDN